MHYLTYNHKNIAYAKDMRKHMTLAEKRMWFEILKKIPQYRFLRQKTIGNYILDFYCAELKLGIEVDGLNHVSNIDYDGHRTAQLEKLGITIIRFSNSFVIEEYERVKEEIERVMSLLKNENQENPPTHPLRRTRHPLAKGVRAATGSVSPNFPPYQGGTGKGGGRWGDLSPICPPSREPTVPRSAPLLKGGRESEDEDGGIGARSAPLTKGEKSSETKMRGIGTKKPASALIVTIMITAVLLIAAVVLLQRIIPYSQSVRGMEDAVQAYYSARSEVEKGVFNFYFQANGSAQSARENSSTIQGTSSPEGLAVISLPTTFQNRIIAAAKKIPLAIKLYALDSNPVNYGTARGTPQAHTLDPRSGFPLRFDLRGVDTSSSSSFTLKMTPKTGSSSPATGTLKVTLTNGTDIVTVKKDLAAAAAPITSIDLHNLEGGINGTTKITSINCTIPTTTICDLFISLEGAGATAFDFTLEASEAIPDINAVIVGESLSGNSQYYQRAIQIEQTRQ